MNAYRIFNRWQYLAYVGILGFNLSSGQAHAAMPPPARASDQDVATTAPPVAPSNPGPLIATPDGGLPDRGSLLSRLCGPDPDDCDREERPEDDVADADLPSLVTLIFQRTPPEEIEATERNISICLLQQLEKPNRGVPGKQYIIETVAKYGKRGDEVRCRLVGAITPYLTHPTLFEISIRKLNMVDLFNCENSAFVSIPDIRGQLKSLIGLTTARQADAVELAIIASELSPADEVYLPAIMTLINPDFNFAVAYALNPQLALTPPSLSASGYLAYLKSWMTWRLRSAEGQEHLNRAYALGGILTSIGNIMQLDHGLLGYDAFDTLSALASYPLLEESLPTVVDGLVTFFLAVDADLPAQPPAPGTTAFISVEQQRLYAMAEKLSDAAARNPDLRCTLSERLYAIANDPGVSGLQKKQNALALRYRISQE